MPRPSSIPVGALAPRAPQSRRNVALLSHAEYVPTLTAAAALRVKDVLSKAAKNKPCSAIPHHHHHRHTYLCRHRIMHEFFWS